MAQIDPWPGNFVCCGAAKNEKEKKEKKKNKISNTCTLIFTLLFFLTLQAPSSSRAAILTFFFFFFKLKGMKSYFMCWHEARLVKSLCPELRPQTAQAAEALSSFARALSNLAGGSP